MLVDWRKLRKLGALEVESHSVEISSDDLTNYRRGLGASRRGKWGVFRVDLSLRNTSCGVCVVVVFERRRRRAFSSETIAAPAPRRKKIQQLPSSSTKERVQGEVERASGKV